MLSLLFVLACADKTPADSAADSPREDEVETHDSDEIEPTGAGLYATHCAACHGEDGHGSDAGPDLARELHHTDEELIAVMIQGKKDMEPADVTEAEAQLIVDWLRENL
jgi:mono/diheme cytochrome c family protein